MRFIISVAELNHLLNRLQNVVGQKVSVPILSNILIEATQHQLILTATDLMVGIRCYTEAKVLEEGGTTLPARRFIQLIRELTASHVEINTNEQDITEVVANSSRFKLHGMSKKEYPTLPELEEKAQFIVSQSTLKEMFYRTAFAVSKEDNRYVLTGVSLQIQDGIASFIGTDGKRLAKCQTRVEIDPSLKGSYVIPLKAVDEIMKNLREEGDATVYLMADKVAVEANQSILITKLLSGEYPDVDRIIPQQLDKHLSLHKDELMSLLKQMSLFTTDANQTVRFTFASGELRISAAAMEIGEGHVSMPVNYHGDKLDIGFNPGFFLDVLRHTKEETLDLGLIDAYNPVIIREEKKNSEPSSTGAALSLLMPMRLDV